MRLNARFCCIRKTNWGWGICPRTIRGIPPLLFADIWWCHTYCADWRRPSRHSAWTTADIVSDRHKAVRMTQCRRRNRSPSRCSGIWTRRRKDIAPVSMSLNIDTVGSDVETTIHPHPHPTSKNLSLSPLHPRSTSPFPTPSRCTCPHPCPVTAPLIRIPIPAMNIFIHQENPVATKRNKLH